MTSVFFKFPTTLLVYIQFSGARVLLLSLNFQTPKPWSTTALGRVTGIFLPFWPQFRSYNIACIHSPIHPCIPPSICSLVYPHNHASIQTLTHRPIHPYNPSIHPLTHPSIHPSKHSFMHPPIIHPTVYSASHSLIHPPNHPSMLPSIHSWNHQSIYSFIPLCVYSPSRLLTYPTYHLLIYLLIYLYVCLFIHHQ